MLCMHGLKIKQPNSARLMFGFLHAQNSAKQKGKHLSNTGLFTLQNGKQGSNLGVLEDDLKTGMSGIFGTSRNPGSVLQKGKQGGNSIFGASGPQ